MAGNGCGSVGRAVASDTKGPRFESNYREIYTLLSATVKYENKEMKEARNGPIRKGKRQLKKRRGKTIKNISKFRKLCHSHPA